MQKGGLYAAQIAEVQGRHAIDLSANVVFHRRRKECWSSPRNARLPKQKRSSCAAAGFEHRTIAESRTSPSLLTLRAGRTLENM
jgi:hypothetical protein